MTNVMERTPPVGWYPETAESTMLRWWDGTAWTDHTMDPEQDVAAGYAAELIADEEMVSAVAREAAVTSTALFDDSAITDETRERIARGYTANTEINLPGLSKSGLGKNSTGQASWWDTSRQPAPTTSSTESVWALAFTPWVAALASLGAALVYTLISPQWGTLIAGALVPVLWMLATAVQDRKSLGELGFPRTASAWWILLGPLAYMIARTISVLKTTDKGKAPLVVLLVNTVAVPVAVFATIELLPGIMGQF
jgi:Protein of unknown function (DUF2510)